MLLPSRDIRPSNMAEGVHLPWSKIGGADQSQGRYALFIHGESTKEENAKMLVDFGDTVETGKSSVFASLNDCIGDQALMENTSTSRKFALIVEALRLA
jgi:hypothetical protein